MIFCVEDDISSRELMIYTLKSAGFDAKGFPESTDFWKALETETPELIMLDIMLPGEDGIEILKKLRKKTKTAYSLYHKSNIHKSMCECDTYTRSKAYYGRTSEGSLRNNFCI